MRVKFVALAALLMASASPLPAFAQFGFAAPSTSVESVRSVSDGISAMAQAIRDARPQVDEKQALVVRAMALAEPENRMALALADGSVSLWDLSQGREARRLTGLGATSLAYGHGGGALIIGQGNGGARILDGKGRTASDIAPAGSAVTTAALSGDGRLAALAGGGQVRLVRVQGGTELAKTSGQSVAGHPVDGLIAVGGADGSVKLWADGQTAPAASLNTGLGAISHMAYAADGSYLLVASGASLAILEAGKPVRTLSAGDTITGLQAGLAQAAVTTGQGTASLDMGKGTLSAAIRPHAKTMTASAPLRDGRLTLTASQDGTMRLSRPGQEMPDLILIARDGWAVVAASGEFDADADGTAAIKWAAEDVALDLDQFSESHFQPGILTRLLNKGEADWRTDLAAAQGRIIQSQKLAAEKAQAEKLAAEKAAAEKAAALKAEKDKAEAQRLAAEKAEADRVAALRQAEEKAAAEAVARAEAERKQAEADRLAAEAESQRLAEEARKAEEAKKVVVSKSFAMPPKASLPEAKDELSVDKEDFDLAYDAQDQGGGILEIRLYQNGKLVHSGKDPQGRIKTRLAQGPNEFRLVALSSDKIESRPAKTKVTYTGAERKSALHVLAVGINQYKNPALNLNYGVGDAKSLADFFAKQPRTLYKDVIIHSLYDNQASKAAILGKLDELQATNPEDMVLIYLAGHGDTMDGSWYFMPHEVRYPEREDEVKEKGIASAELNDRIKKMGAQKVLFLVDACKSGAALVAFRGFEDRKALMAVSRSSGVHVVAAAGKEQFAAEITQLGHGLFTYTLLEGLNGKADRKQNKTITVRGLTNYIEDQLPEISQSYKGVAQFPVVDSRGQDFPVAVN